MAISCTVWMQHSIYTATETLWVLFTACKTVQVSETDFIQMCIVQSRVSTTWHTQSNSRSLALCKVALCKLHLMVSCANSAAPGNCCNQC